jgi:hypothetical protein
MPAQITVLASGHHRSHPCSPRTRRLTQFTAQLAVRTSAAHLAQRQIRMVPRARASCWLCSPRRARVPSIPPRLPVVRSCFPAPRGGRKPSEDGWGVALTHSLAGLRSVFWEVRTALEVASHAGALVLNQPALVREVQNRAAVAAQLSVLSRRTACFAEPVALLILLRHDSPGVVRSVGVSMRIPVAPQLIRETLCSSPLSWCTTIAKPPASGTVNTGRADGSWSVQHGVRVAHVRSEGLRRVPLRHVSGGHGHAWRDRPPAVLAGQGGGHATPVSPGLPEFGEDHGGVRAGTSAPRSARGPAPGFL